MLTSTGFAVVAYSLVGAGLAAQGLRYLIALQFMHYHEEVLRERWSQLQPAEQRLMLGLLKGFGAGMFCVGLTTIFVAVGPLRDGLYRAHWFEAALTIVYTAMLMHITRLALLPKAAPITVTTAMLGTSIAASVASLVF